MPGTMSTLESLALTKSDLKQGRDVVEGISSVARWIRKGKHVEDIEMEADNAISCAANHVAYQAMRERLLSKYGIDECTLVRLLLSDIAER
jgi:hypothetical protein